VAEVYTDALAEFIGTEGAESQNGNAFISRNIQVS